jgi:hypothetical protein
MGDLPFVVPTDVSDEADEYDGGFLRSVLPKLKRMGVRHDFRGIVDVLGEFGNEHTSCMIYSPRFDESWFPCNYAYEAIRFEGVLPAFSGLAYHVTHFDGTRHNGDESSFLEPNPDVGAMLIPYFLGDDMKAVVLAEEHEHNLEHYGVYLLVGNRFGNDVMPCFR